MTAGGALFDAIVGQEAAVALLRRAVATDRIAHAYAFVGPSGVGRRLAARAFAQALLCQARGCGRCAPCRRVAAGQHPDCLVVGPTPPEDNPRGAPILRIEQIRAVEHRAALAPLEGPRKVFVLDEAERMSLPTAQALLKTLEEPPSRTVLVLVLASPRALPPTVLSRCQQVRFRPLEAAAAARVLEAHGVPADESPLLARLVQGQPGLALGGEPGGVAARRAAALAVARTPLARVAEALDAAKPDRAMAAGWLEAYWLWYRDALCLAAGAPAEILVNGDQEAALREVAGRVPVVALAAALQAVKTAWLALEGNVGPRLALERALVALAPLAAGAGA